MGVTPLFTEAELRSRMSGIALDRILDDNGDGAADIAPIARIIKDASSVVWAYLPTDYEIEDEVPDYLNKLALDVAQATLYVRHPEFKREDGHTMLKTAHTELERYSKQLTRVKEVPRTDAMASVTATSSTTSRRDGWTR